MLSDTPHLDGGAKEYAAITIGNCGANSEEGAQMIVRHKGTMNAFTLNLKNRREVRIQETTVVALKNCAASSQEAAFLIADCKEVLLMLKDLSLDETQSRLRDVVSLKVVVPIASCSLCVLLE